jgi:hypothetical protein
VFYSSFIIKIPKSSKRRSFEKNGERERKSIEKEEVKRKAPRVYANKMGKSIF